MGHNYLCSLYIPDVTKRFDNLYKEDVIQLFFNKLCLGSNVRNVYTWKFGILNLSELVFKITLRCFLDYLMRDCKND